MNILLFALMALNAGPVTASSQPDAKRIAILISSYGTQNPQLSYDLEELAQAYLVLHDHQIAIDIVSPLGGAVPVKTNKDDLSYIKRFKQQTKALQQLGATLAAKDVQAETYDGVFVVGGSGAMMDLPNDAGVHKLLSWFVANGKPIAAVCHGPAALVDIKSADGGYFVTGKKVCSFTNVEEKAFSSESLEHFPFLIEDKMRERKAQFVANAPMLPYVAVDGSLITAQNPGSVARAAEALVILLGLPLKPRELFKDEATMALIANARVSGPFQIDLAINANSQQYDLQYLALYAFYSYRLAETSSDKLVELGIMEAVSRHFSHPMLLDALVRAQHEQGHRAKAAVALKKLAAEYPDHKSIGDLKQLLQEQSEDQDTQRK